jgi:predicted glycosyltransferase
LDLRPGEKLVVASCGGGRAGYRLLKSVLAACTRLSESQPLRLTVFTGPFMAEEEFNDLQSMAGERISVQRFTSHFLDYLSAADLSISLAGYNTCMNLLTTGVPALVLPYSRQREQPLRVEKLLPYLPLQVLGEEDLEPSRLERAIERGWALERRTAPVPVRLDGAETAARLLADLHSLTSP